MKRKERRGGKERKWEEKLDRRKERRGEKGRW